MSDREPIIITPETKGVIVYAKSTKPTFSDWILLIRDVQEVRLDLNTNDLMIYTHISWNTSADFSYANVDVNHRWGYVHHYKFEFFKPTQEEINIIKTLLKNNNKKFVKGINKLFDR